MKAAGFALVVLLALPWPAGAVTQELSVIYQSPRALGMGGADVAVGGQPTALFSNPAGLARMRPGRTTQLLVTAGLSHRTRSFFDAANEALDADTANEQQIELSDVVRRFRGDNLHFNSHLLPNVSWHGESWALSGAWLESVTFNGRTHQALGSAGAVSIDARRFSGAVVGAAHFSGPMAVGISVKRLRMERLRKGYSVRELVEITEADGSITDDVESGRATGFDVGVQYDLAPGYRWRPTFGASVQNVGGMDFGDAGKMPQIVSLGLAIEPHAPRTSRLRLAAEYFDLLHEATADTDHGKRVRVGAEWWPWERRRHALALRAGLYQGAYTAGIDVHLHALRLGLATYAEEQGAFMGQDRDRRYLLTVGLEL